MSTPRKSTAPYGGPPKWLDARHELELPESSGYTEQRFVAEVMGALLALGCSPRQAAEVCANAMGEAARGRAVWHGNPYGWKITQAHSRAWRAANGPDGPPWFKARGNVASADSAWCFYRAFPSIAESVGEWLAHFVPRVGASTPYPRYRKAGAAFWADDPAWFRELILAGYKGEPSAELMRDIRAAGKRDTDHPSVPGHHALARTSLRLWAQHRLGVEADGKWGPKSRAECCAVQRGAGLAETGELDDATLAALAPGGGA